jgi:hypothetical protein
MRLYRFFACASPCLAATRASELFPFATENTLDAVSHHATLAELLGEINSGLAIVTPDP